VSFFVDTSVWSLALQRDRPRQAGPVAALSHALEEGQPVITTGLVLQELLQGFAGPKARGLILSAFSALPLLMPDRDDHIAAATLRNTCRRAGVQAGTIDALIAQLCIRHDLPLLSTDEDFEHIARHISLKIWRAAV
jgi:predicted nucleic acid-binding protein